MKFSSTWNTVKCCVPQRSVLGPLLFSIYIDGELCSVDNSSNVIMYTDDRSIVTANNCYKVFNRNLIQHPHIFQANPLVLNTETTKIGRFTHANFSSFPFHTTFVE